MTSKPSWLPDWRDESAYEDHGDDLRSWAWEFLRRNSEYQADYANWSALPDTDTDEHGITGNSLKYYRTYGDWESMIYFQTIDGIDHLDGETVAEYEARTKGTVEPLHSYLEKKWGISELMDPAGGCGPNLYETEIIPPYDVEFASGYGIEIHPPKSPFGNFEWMKGRLMVASWPEELDPAVLTLAFDLRFPINAQIEAAREHLMSRQQQPVDSELSPEMQKEKRTTQHRGSLLLRLRHLDAELSGASKNEMILELYDREQQPADSSQHAHDIGAAWAKSGERWVERHLSEAKRLTNDGYRDLLKWSCLPEPKPKKATRQKRL